MSMCLLSSPHPLHHYPFPLLFNIVHFPSSSSLSISPPLQHCPFPLLFFSSIIPMNYYGRNDIPLGEFLHRYCFRDFYECQSCGVDMMKHQRHFVHSDYEMRISMQQLAAPIPGGDNRIFTWCNCQNDVCSQVCMYVCSVHTYIYIFIYIYNLYVST